MKLLSYILLFSLLIAFNLSSDTELPQSNVSISAFREVINIIQNNALQQIPEKKLIEYAINGMLSKLDDYSGYLDYDDLKEAQIQAAGKFAGIGIEITLHNNTVKVISPIDGSPAARAGILPGDTIIAIDNKQLSNATLHEITKKIRGILDTYTIITIARNNEIINFNLKLENVKIHTVKTYNRNNILYLRISAFTANTTHDIKRQLRLAKRQNKTIKGIILDLRNNPGGLLEQALAVADLFLDKKEIVYIKSYDKKIQHYYANSGDMTEGVPIIVLINRGSASAAEIVAGSLQDNKRALVIGERSFGKAAVQKVFAINKSGFGAIRLTTARYYLPSGLLIHNRGIIPDIRITQNNQVKADNNQKRKYRKTSHHTDYLIDRAKDLLKGIEFYKELLDK